MKILIAEDDNFKMKTLEDFFVSDFEGVSITITKSKQETIRSISEHNYDLILLDMTMPSYEGESEMERGELRPLAGSDIISRMAYRKTFIPTIVVTQFEVFGRGSGISQIDKVMAELKEKFPEIVKGHVLFNLQSSTWRNELKTLVDGVFHD
ncbi:response regulator [Shewanella algae]|uniref:response regulator n=1 Tax=Shewanella algae TaxID=38313 RepID=UPI002935F96F|nr:response regulator [Shewanella algae]MDV2962477.1 response regulator [Shewanella algae]